jgi:hypothetical protein
MFVCADQVRSPTGSLRRDLRFILPMIGTS